MSGTNYISGLVSNLDWATVIDQLMSIERRKIDVVEARRTTHQDKLYAWSQFQTKLATFKTRLSALRTVESFNQLQVSATSSSAVYAASDLVSLSVDSDAAPGNHLIEMSSGCRLAQARQVSSASFTTSDEALELSGEFVINGRAVQVETTDSLMDIADRINALNSGSQATHVTASVLAAGSSDYRLILTADNTGADAFSLQEGGSSSILLRSGGLGFYESYDDTLKHTTSDGATSDAFSSATVSVKSLRGLSAPPGSTVVQIGGQNVTIDLSSDTETLTTIAEAIDTALGASGSAEVVAETEDGVTTYRIDVSGTTTFSDSNNVLQVLGFVEGSHANVAKSLLSANTLYTASSGGSSEITAATSFDDIYGYAAGTGDTITISGYTNNGTALTPTDFDVYSGGAYQTVGDLLTAIENAYAAAGATVTASVSGGKIKVVDSAAGSSQMALSLVANNEGGGNLDFGAVGVETQGYSQQTMAGADAVIKVDGVYVESSSNTISDAIEGLTLNLLRMETGTTINVSVTRDHGAIQASVQGVVDAYNDILAFITEQFTYDEDAESGGVLMGDVTLRGVKSTLQELIAGQIPGLPSGWNALSLIGVHSDANGVLSIDSTLFSSQARDDFNAFRRVLGADATVTDADISYVAYGKNTQAGTYAISVTQAATQGADTGWKDLTSGIGGTATETIRITDTLTGRQATVEIDPSGNGSSIDNLVNALNSELSATYTEVLVGSVANTRASDANPLTAATTWDNITGATLSNQDVISFEGTDRAGNAVSGTYQITDTTTDTVQGLLSAIEAAYGAQASAYLDPNGRIVLQETQAGDSSLSISITTPTGSGLDFGDIDYSEGAGDGSVQGRGVMSITAAADGSGHLVLTHELYGSSYGFSVEQVSDPSGTNKEVVLASAGNTTASSGGTVEVTAATPFDDIYGYTADTADTIVISGTGHDGSAIDPVTFNVYSGGAYQTLGDLLTEIEGAFSAAGFTVTAAVESGKIKLVDETTGLSGVSLELAESTVDPDLDLGVFGSAATGLANAAQAGQDVAGTINGEACTGSGRLLAGDAPGLGETTSVEGLSVLVNLTPAQLASQGSDQGTISLTTGAMERLWRAVDGMTDSGDGLITIRTQGIQDTIDDLEDTISSMEVRLEQRREQLFQSFVALEQALSHLQSISAWLSASFSYTVS